MSSPTEIVAEVELPDGSEPAYCRELNGEISSVNAAFSRRFGVTVDGDKSVNVIEMVHGEDVEMLKLNGADRLVPTKPVASAQRWKTSQGFRWIQWEEVAVVVGDKVVIKAVGRDITRQKITEEHSIRLTQAIEQSPIAIAIVGLEGQPLFVNQRYTALTGRTLESVIEQRRNILREMHNDDDSYFVCLAMLKGGSEWSGELTGKKGENVTWESVKASCLRSSDGKISGYLCMREDVTERKRLENSLRQSQKMESLGMLAGGIAHDFNNVIAIIQGFAEICREGAAPLEVIKKSLGEIRRASQRGSDLVRRILSFGSNKDTNFAPIDLGDTTKDLLALLSGTFPKKIAFDIQLSQGLPMIMADTGQIQQVVLNLCVNARDAIPPAGGTIQISTGMVAGSSLLHLGPANDSGHYARLSVSDTGKGMTEEVRAKIFEPFYTTKHDQGGTGLGLSVVSGIVKSHHGFIAVESTLNRGTVFHVYLPI